MVDDDAKEPSPATERFHIDISEIAALIKISDEMGVDISKSRRLLLIAINIGKTSKNFDIIMQYLDESKLLMETAIAENIVTKLKDLHNVIESKKEINPQPAFIDELYSESFDALKEKKFNVALRNMKMIIENLEDVDRKQAMKSESVVQMLASTLRPSDEPVKPKDTEIEPKLIQSRLKELAGKPETQQMAEKPAPVEPKVKNLVSPEKVINIEFTPALETLEPALRKDTVSRQFVVEKASEQLKCANCKGKIKPGLPVIICHCGETYHESCGIRIKTCSNCHTPFV